MRHWGLTSRSRASFRYSNADSPNNRVPNNSETSTSGKSDVKGFVSPEVCAEIDTSRRVLTPRALRMSSASNSVDKASKIVIVPSKLFALIFLRASAAMCGDASMATTRLAPNRAANIANKPEPVPISNTTDSPGTMARRRHSL